MTPNPQPVPVEGETFQSPNQQRKEIYYDGYFYDVTEWVRRHPGGKIIEFYTKKGEDSTLAVQEFHTRSTKRVMAIMNSLKKRPATPEELGMDKETAQRHEALTRDFQKLKEELVAEGMFKPSIPHVIYRIFEVVAFCVLGMYLLSFQNMVLRVLGILSFAMFQGRCGWLMHEGGHHSLTGNPKADRFLQAVIYGIGDGMSSSWWSSQHNRHHAMPQRLKHDVDLDTMPLIAFNKKVVKKKEEGKSFFIRHQSILFILVDTFLVTTFWKMFLHPRYIIQKGTYIQLLFMGLHYVLGYNIGLVPYLISVWLASIYIFGNFSLSHTHLPVTDKPIHWVEYSLLHTMDIRGVFVDWWMCYLNYQIEHHLFPTMPQFRHPLIRDRVVALAKKHNIPYYENSYIDASLKTYNNLADVAKDLRHGM